MHSPISGTNAISNIHNSEMAKQFLYRQFYLKLWIVFNVRGSTLCLKQVLICLLIIGLGSFMLNNEEIP